MGDFKSRTYAYVIKIIVCTFLNTKLLYSKLQLIAYLLCYDL